MVPQPAPVAPDTTVISTERAAEIEETCYVFQEEWQLIEEIIGLSQIEVEAMADVCDQVGVNIYGAVADVPEENICDPSYPDVCIPPYPPDLNCGEISFKNFKVLPPDPHRFDGDKDGIGCQS